MDNPLDALDELLVLLIAYDGELVQIGDVDDLEEAYGDLYKEAD